MPSQPPSSPGAAAPNPLYLGLFERQTDANGSSRVARSHSAPHTIPCPNSGRPLRVATLEADAAAICPACSNQGRGGFVTFVADLRMAYACPACRELVWLQGL